MSSLAGDFEKRLIDLESKSSFQESELLDMSTALIDQSARIEKLEATIRALREKVKELAGEGQPQLPPNERPPHY
jgi:uncharacterized coiled-coil protein SlyX